MNKLMRVIDYLFIKLFSLLPLNKKWIVLHSLPDFSDNAWAFYQYLLKEEYNKTYRIIWLVKDPKKYRNELNVTFVKNDSKFLRIGRDYYLARAKWVVFTHRTPIGRWRKGQFFIHTTHSASQVKAAGGQLDETKWRSIPTFKLRCGADGLERMMNWTHLPIEKFLVIGMPRLDLLFSHKDCMNVLFPNKEYRKVLIVLETFRQARLFSDSSFVNHYGLNIIRSENELFSLDDYLVKNDVLMVIKPHPMQDVTHIQMKNLNNICFLKDSDLEDAGIQLYQLLENCDALLTDYSSIYYDYLLLNRPIGFMISDIEEYKRGFIVENPMDEMPGMKLTNLMDLQQFVDLVFDGIDQFAADRQSLKDRVFKFQDNQNSKRLMDFISQK